MKVLFTVLGAALLLSSLALAADIDGKWASERTMNRDGQEFTIKTTMDLKTDGAKLTGKIMVAFGEMERSMDVKDGKVDGNKFSFTTIMETPNGEMKMLYEGSVDGKTMKGTTSREGGQSRPFEAKKQ